MNKWIVYGILFICILLMYWFPHAMINPGQLVEGHRQLDNECSACHDAFRGISTTKCISCHQLENIGKDSTAPAQDRQLKEKILFHDKLVVKECTNCHSDHQGLHPPVGVARFNHEFLSPPDQGKCSSCHNRPEDKLHQLFTSECKSCHTTADWKKGASFNHGLLSVNALNNCSSCHAKPQDNMHNFTQENCTSCHDTSHWKPSTFDHSRYFVLDRDHNVKCETCHTENNFKAYTCYGCHEHTPAKIRSEHMEEGITNFENCVRCHKSADEHDIRMGEGSGGKQLNEQEKQQVKGYIEKQGKKKEKDREDND